MRRLRNSFSQICFLRRSPDFTDSRNDTHIHALLLIDTVCYVMMRIRGLIIRKVIHTLPIRNVTPGKCANGKYAGLGISHNRCGV
jgi:hypothetical protein